MQKDFCDFCGKPELHGRIFGIPPKWERVTFYVGRRRESKLACTFCANTQSVSRLRLKQLHEGIVVK